jgi:hypothetical protein
MLARCVSGLDSTPNSNRAMITTLLLVCWSNGYLCLFVELAVVGIRRMKLDQLHELTTYSPLPSLAVRSKLKPC